jgi:hypothetical protein
MILPDDGWEMPSPAGGPSAKNVINYTSIVMIVKRCVGMEKMSDSGNTSTVTYS